MDRELEIIRRFASILYPEGDNPLWFGDDAWVSEPDENGYLQVITCDSFSEGIHFNRDYFSPVDIGIKTVNATLSDIAAMGATPLYLSFCISIPPTIGMEYLSGIAEGIAKSTSVYDVKVINADTIGSKEGLNIAIFVIGQVKEGEVLKRRGASVGDVIALTGELGNSWAGYSILTGAVEGLSETDTEIARLAHLNPLARIDVGRTLARSGYVTSCADLSDSLSKQLKILTLTNDVDVDVDLTAVPLSGVTKEVGKILEIDTDNIVLGCGEDYELLITVDDNHFEELKELLDRKHRINLSRIGIIREGEEVYVIKDGKRVMMEVVDYHHFKDNDRVNLYE